MKKRGELKRGCDGALAIVVGGGGDDQAANGRDHDKRRI